MLYKLLKKIYKYFNYNAVNKIKNTKMPLIKQKQYLNLFPKPQDDYQRSYFKFKCFCEYCYYDRKWMLLIYNLGAMIVYPFLYLRMIYKGQRLCKINMNCDAVIENVPRLPNIDILPNEIKEQYKNKIDITSINYENIYLNKNAEEICKELKLRYYWQFYFRLITMIKLAQFSSYIEQYHPKAIVFYSCEREFSGPLQTYLCEREKVRYESFMHGDYLYSLCFAFQRYSHYYTWDESYNTMFDELRCASPMTVYVPEKFKGIAKKINEHECKYFATYYFSGETRKSAEIIYSVFEKFINLGLRCKIRPHPRFSNIKMLKEVFFNIEVENINEVSLADSIINSLYIIGLNTTVLSQAYFSEKNVVIDDISAEKEYLELKDKKYIMLNRPHILLSVLEKLIINEFPYDQTYNFILKTKNKKNV